MYDIPPHKKYSFAHWKMRHGFLPFEDVSMESIECGRVFGERNRRIGPLLQWLAFDLRYIFAMDRMPLFIFACFWALRRNELTHVVWS